MPPPRPQPSIVQTEPHVELPVFGPHTFEKAVENAKAYLDKWPLIPEPEKGVLLQDGVNRMEKTLRSKRLAPIGWQDKNWHRQVLEMCNRQLRQLKYGHYFGRTDTKRREIALSIAGSYNRGWKAATRILNHERQWILEGTIPLSKQGKHAKTLCMLEDPSTRDAMMEYIHGAGRNACSLGLAKAVTAYWKASELPELQERHLAERTANEWFKRCGYKWSDIRKGVYKDGHEREDVVKYRKEVFLPRMAELEPTLVKWELQEATTTEPEHLVLREPDPSSLPPGIRPRLLCTHDECSFNSTDGQHRGWVHEDHVPFFNKGRGQGMMTSEFVTPGDGNLKMPPELPDDSDELPLEPDGDRFRECTQLLDFGKDGYWTCDRVLLTVLPVSLYRKCVKLVARLACPRRLCDRAVLLLSRLLRVGMSLC
jgi:hypothetical protein